jgi:hypothetical protein
MDFDNRLEQAIERGQRIRNSREQTEHQKTLSEEELKNLHSSVRLNLSEHIESCLRSLSDHFPGFRFETVVDDSGWGARINRDDLSMGRGRRDNHYSRLQVLVKPYSAAAKIVEITAKGTVRNRELLNRTHYQFLAELNEDGLQEVIDMWILEFAEQYSAQN